MKTSEELKNVVKEKYGKIAVSMPQAGCCGTNSSCCGDSSNVEFAMIGDEYKNLKPKDFEKSMNRVNVIDAQRILEPQKFEKISFSAIGLGT